MLGAPPPHSPRQGPRGGQAPPVQKGWRQRWDRDPRSQCLTCHGPCYGGQEWDTGPQPITHLLSSAASGSWWPLRKERA